MNLIIVQLVNHLPKKGLGTSIDYAEARLRAINMGVKMYGVHPLSTYRGVHLWGEEWRLEGNNLYFVQGNLKKAKEEIKEMREKALASVLKTETYT
jgi:hypothetical protein